MPISEWGPKVWKFIHTFINHMSEDFFQREKRTVCNYLLQTVRNLPCPHCSLHAKQYTKRVTHANFKTKKDLEEYFFTFHNNVNKRLNKVEFKREDLNIYNDYDLYPAFINFGNIYINNRMNRDKLHLSHGRRVLAYSLKKFLVAHAKELNYIPNK